MEPVQTILLSFSGVFTFAFGLAWLLPLVTAGQEQRTVSKGEVVTTLLDIALLLLDYIPVFWIFRAIPEAPSAYRAARLEWNNNASLRISFWLSAISLATFVGCIYIFP